MNLYRAPISCWYHFGTQYLPGEKYAENVLSFYEYYDFDWLKVMNDYYYPMPAGMESLKSSEDLRKIQLFDIENSPFNEQLKALGIISKHLNGNSYFCDTVFDPYQQLQKSLVGENLPRLMKEEPEAVLDALDVVSEMLIRYAHRVLDCGAHGIFMSVLDGRDQVSREDFLKFAKPFAIKVFDAVKDKGAMNTVHLHGKGVVFENYFDFPVSVLSWEDRLPENPSLQEIKNKWDGCVMGGLDHNIMVGRTREALIKNTLEGIALGGRKRFFLVNGCSSPAGMNCDSLKAMVEVAQGIR